MSNTVIKIENLSKIYRLGEIGTGTLSHDLNRWWAMNIRGKDDPYALVGGVNDRTAKARKGEHIAALKDINLEVKQGEVLGIIGKNGAGKSTLLKVLSRVTSPTTGSISVKGRLASLLEVGTGFHPEMTGRENIYMNGTIMGMRKWEITRKLDEIVEFAGVAKYLDTPVKRYSSGMKVRLGFAVAAHLEPEILVVDEVLAVGDAEFQKKAIGKMQDVSTNDGRTVLFVSHNMASVKSLCKKGVELRNGTISYYNDIDHVINHYLEEFKFQDLTFEKTFPPKQNQDFQLLKAELSNNKGEVSGTFECDEDIFLRLTFKYKSKLPSLMGIVKIGTKNDDSPILISDSNDICLNKLDLLPLGTPSVIIKIPKRTLGVGDYTIYTNFTCKKANTSINVDSPFHILSFSLHDNRTIRGNKRKGVLSTLLEWKIQ